MALSRRALASGRAIFGAIAAAVLLRRPASGQQPAAVAGTGAVSEIAVSTIAALRGYDTRQFAPGAQVIAQVSGYRRPGDGGGGVFEWLPGSTAQDDPATPNAPPIVNV